MKTKYEDLSDRPFLLVPALDERKKDIPLDSIGGLIFGYLVYLRGNEDEKERSASRTKISRSLRLDKKAVDRSVTVLIEGGAVLEQGGRVGAVEPQGESAGWFRQLRSAKGEWHERFVYDRVFLPQSSSTLSVRTNLLFWHLVRLGHSVDRMPGYLQVGDHPTNPPRYLTSKYLANGLNCYPRTVIRGLERLKSLGLIKIQAIAPRKFVIGIPPIGESAMLWRESWKRKQAKTKPAEVTAESLFGVPSSDVLQPAQAAQTEAATFIRSCGIRGKIAEEIVTKLTKYQVPPREWKPVLSQARRTHEENRDKYQIPHCGCLFKVMVEDLIKKLEAQSTMERWSHVRSYAETVSRDLMRDLRVPSNAQRLLETAIREEQLPLRDGGCVPCRLHWEDVQRVGEASGKDFQKFKRGVANVIFLTHDGEPKSDWYDAWMSMQQIPEKDDTPMDKLRFSHKEKQRVRMWATRIASQHRDETDEVGFKAFINNLIRIACEQAEPKTQHMVESAMDQISRALKAEEKESLVVEELAVGTVGTKV